MSDSFFGFDADAPACDDGAKLGHVEDEIDLMNDETFGESATADDWEEAHEKLKEVVEGVRGDFSNGHHGEQSHLEHDLEQLVVDDEDTMVHGKAIPRKRATDLADLFGPSSPPGLLNTEELMGGKENIWGSPAKDSPLCHSHPSAHFMRAGHPQQQRASSITKDDGLKGLIRQLQQPPQPFQDPTIISTGKVLSSSLPSGSMKAMADVEHQLLTSAATPPGLPGYGGGVSGGMMGRQRAMTVEELEREFVSGSGEMRRGSEDHQNHSVLTPGHVHILKRSSPPPGSLPMPIGTPPQPHTPLSHHTHLAGVLPRSPAPGSLPTGASPHNARVAATPGLSQSIQSKRISPPLAPGTPVGSHGDGQHVSPSPLQPAQRNRMPPGPPPDLMRPPPHHHHHQPMPGYHGHPQNQMFPPRGPRPRYPGPGPYNQMPPGPPPPFMGRGYDGYPGGGMNYRGRGQHMGRGMGPQRGGYYQHQQHYDYKAWNDEEGEEGRDEYAGLMSEREKDWVIKIQLRQLQTDNPYLDDFYYTSVQMKKLARESLVKEDGKGSGDTRLVIPQIACHDTNKTYIPLQFEGSLGRLTASSVHNPRRIIDVTGSSQHEQDEARSNKEGGRRFKQLLISIERGYDTLLDVDELEKRALALPDERRDTVMVERRQKVEHLYFSIMAAADQADVFSRLLAIRKGAKLVARLFPLLGNVESHKLMSHFLGNLSNLSKRDWHRDVWPVILDNLKRVFFTSNLESLACYTHIITKQGESSSGEANPIASIIHTQLGASVVWSMVNRGETVYSTVSPVDMEIDHQETWNGFISQLADTVDNMSVEALAKPLMGGHYYNVCRHLQRMLDETLYSSVENKLKPLMTHEPIIT